MTNVAFYSENSVLALGIVAESPQALPLEGRGLGAKCTAFMNTYKTSPNE